MDITAPWDSKRSATVNHLQQILRVIHPGVLTVCPAPRVAVMECVNARIYTRCTTRKTKGAMEWKGHTVNHQWKIPTTCVFQAHSVIQSSRTQAYRWGIARTSQPIGKEMLSFFSSSSFS